MSANENRNRKITIVKIRALLLNPISAVMTDDLSFPITSDRPDMSGETDVGPTKYPVTSDLQSGYFFVQFRFFVSQGENQPLTTYCSLKFILCW